MLSLCKSKPINSSCCFTLKALHQQYKGRLEANLCFNTDADVDSSGQNHVHWPHTGLSLCCILVSAGWMSSTQPTSSSARLWGAGANCLFDRWEGDHTHRQTNVLTHFVHLDFPVHLTCLCLDCGQKLEDREEAKWRQRAADWRKQLMKFISSRP